MPDQLETLILQMHRGGILYSEAVREFKRMYIATVLRESKGNQVQAARHLHKHRNTLRRLIRKLEVDTSNLRQPPRRPPRPERRDRSDKTDCLP